MREKVPRQCPQTTTFLKRKESRSGIEPRYQPNALPLGQTGSLLLQGNSTRTKHARRGLSRGERPSAKLQALVYNILPSRRKVPESGARSVTLCMQTEFSSPRKELWTRQDSSIRRAQQSKTDCPCGFENQEE